MELAKAVSAQHSFDRIGEEANSDDASVKLELESILREERRSECLALVIAYLESEVQCGRPFSDSSLVDTGKKRQSPFHNKCQPRIGLADYVHRLAKFTNASSLSFIMACSYIEQLCKDSEAYRVSEQTVHRFLLCGLLLAAKLADDKFRSNAYFSKVGGVSKAVLHEMEMHMFSRLQYSLFLSETALAQQLQLMCTKVGPESLASLFKDESISRRSKKRISEDVGFGSEDDLPAKLPHDEQHDTVNVTGEKAEESAMISKEASKVLSAVVSRESSRQSSLSGCAQELTAAEKVSSLKSLSVPALPGS